MTPDDLVERVARAIFLEVGWKGDPDEIVPCADNETMMPRWHAEIDTARAALATVAEAAGGDALLSGADFLESYADFCNEPTGPDGRAAALLRALAGAAETRA